MRQHGVNVLLEIVGEPQEDVLICKTCNETKPVSCFYVESSSKRTKSYQRRRQCIDCWAELKGKMRKSKPFGATLFYYEAI